MADNKKYYYLKVKENFFDSDEMIILESMPDGYLYSNILLKLYLRSVSNGGRLMFKERIPFNSTMLAQVTRHNVGTVEKAIQIFKDLGLIEILDNGAIYMLDIQNFIGQSSTEADRKREYRREIEQEKQFLLEQGHVSDKCPDKSTPELEIEKDIEIEKEIKNTVPDKSANTSIITKNIKEIVDYLNQKAKSNFKATTKATQTKIRARLAEGFNVDDFKKVIDIKTAEWLDDANMSQYLRPETLFGTKFESYLNQKQAVKRVNAQNNWVKSPVKHEEMPNWNSRSTGSDPSRKAEIEKMMNEFFTDNEEEDK